MRYSILFATAFAVCLHFVSALKTPLTLRAHDVSPSLSQMQAVLGTRLSKSSLVYISNNPGTRNHTGRWSTAAEGDVLIVVTPTSGKDVAKAVCLLSHNA